MHPIFNIPFSVHGHRGFRGKVPENTTAGFKKAIESGCHAIELDVVVSRDNKLIISHDPFLNPEFTTGKNLIRQETHFNQMNLYQMDYRDMSSYDIGNVHPAFPDQEKQIAQIPSFTSLVQYMRENCRKKFIYNIEIKSRPEWYGTLQPHPKEFLKLINEQIIEVLDPKDYFLQSFDINMLKVIRKEHENSILSLLVENQNTIEENIMRLGFKPDIYAPDYNLLTEDSVNKLKSYGITVIPWTVNDPDEAMKLKNWGVNGVISDFPEAILNLI